MKISEKLKKLIKEGKRDKALWEISLVDDYNEGEMVVFDCVEDESGELLEAALKQFVRVRENRYREHGGWVHSLSHFTKHLWARKMTAWIKQLNEIAFTGANHLGDCNCCYRLVSDFVKYAEWSEKPEDYGLTPENMMWVESCGEREYMNADLRRIAASPFASEAEFVLFKLRDPEHQRNHWGEPRLDNVHKLIVRLHELGAYLPEFDGLEEQLVRERVEQLKTMLERKQKQKDEYAEREVKSLTEQIQELMLILENMTKK